MSEHHEPFSDPQAVAKYADGPTRIVPGFADLHRMTMLLLAERACVNAQVLVVGAGGGLELKAFAEAQTEWSFLGVDPSQEMLRQSQRTLGKLISRVQLHHGYIDGAPDGPFDGATCLLTLHFVPINVRSRMLKDIRRRLRPGAAFVVAHLSMPTEYSIQAEWVARYAAFGTKDGVEVKPEAFNAALRQGRLHVVSPEEDEAALREAGFSKVSLFYVGFAFRGWVGYA